MKSPGYKKTKLKVVQQIPKIEDLLPYLQLIRLSNFRTFEKIKVSTTPTPLKLIRDRCLYDALSMAHFMLSTW